MKKYPILIVALACNVYSQGMLVASVKQLQGSRHVREDLRRAFQGVHDSAFVDEILDLDRRRDEVQGTTREGVLHYTFDRQVIARARFNRELRQQLKSLLESDRSSRELKYSLVRNYWKMGASGADLAVDEERLRTAFADNSGDPRLRHALLKKIATTSDQNVAFLFQVTETASDPQAAALAVRQLGRLGTIAQAENKPALKEKISRHLRSLRAKKKVQLSALGAAPVLTDSEDGRDFLKAELEKDGFQDWQATLVSMKDEVGYEYFRRLYRAAKGDAEARDALRLIAKASLQNRHIPAGFNREKDKLEFLEIRTLVGASPELGTADALVAKYLGEKNEAVRHAAVMAAHYCLQPNYQLLSEAYRKETSPVIKDFLHTYGYAE